VKDFTTQKPKEVHYKERTRRKKIWQWVYYKMLQNVIWLQNMFFITWTLSNLLISGKWSYGF